MRIVVVTTSYPRSEGDPAGHFVRSFARRLALGPPERGLPKPEVHVIAPGGSVHETPQWDGAVVVHRAGGEALFRWPGALAQARREPWRLLAGGVFAAGVVARLHDLGPVDRAVAHWIVPTAFPLLLGLRCPVEAHGHGADVRLLLALPRLLRLRIVEALLDRGTVFTFAANALLDRLARAVGPLEARLRSASRVEPPAIDIPWVQPLAEATRGTLDLREGERLAVVVGRLIPSKRVGLALRAVNAASGRWRLTVVGDGPERKALEALAAQLGVAVQFTGTLPRREALGWLAAADLLLHPSGQEAAPSVVREARALGVPVLACEAGDVGSWAQSDPGLRLLDPSVEAFTRALDAH